MNTGELIELARSKPDRAGVTHWDGCEVEHLECLLRKLADAAEAWMLAAESSLHARWKLAQVSERDENLLLWVFDALNAASKVEELPPICVEVIARLSDRLVHGV